ncbi:MAG TPA: TerB family tellurite resistance protein [Stellaceae bacterium]|nr:TerB family tellurite resistance protein [Stellaceae bacterium]
MSTPPTPDRPPGLWAEFVANYLDLRDEEMVTALVAAAALVARADGAVDPIERRHFIEFLARERLLAGREPDEILASLDAMALWLDDQGGAVADALRALRGRRALTVILAAEHVAAADGELRLGEQDALRFIRRALGGEGPDPGHEDS